MREEHLDVVCPEAEPRETRARFVRRQAATCA
jgi:hypothetical protein